MTQRNFIYIYIYILLSIVREDEPEQLPRERDMGSVFDDVDKPGPIETLHPN